MGDKEKIEAYILSIRKAHEANIIGYYNQSTPKPMIYPDKIYKVLNIPQSKSIEILNELDTVETITTVNRIKLFRAL